MLAKRIIPGLDVKDGRVVKGTNFEGLRDMADPVDMARRFEDMGFTRLHLVDLDGAKSRHVVNDHVLKAITRATKLIVDFGGGVKTDEDMARVLDAGAEMVTCGSIAVTQPDTVLGWMERYGAEHLILGADAKDGKISINGWQEDSAYELMPFLQRYLDAGMMHVLCTDISRDGMLQGPATALYSSIMQAFPHCRLIASGGVSCIEDILQLDKAGVPAVVFGKAIYEGKINMKELAEMAF